MQRCKGTKILVASPTSVPIKWLLAFGIIEPLIHINPSRRAPDLWIGMVLKFFFGVVSSARKRVGIFVYYKDLRAFLSLSKIRDRRY